MLIEDDLGSEDILVVSSPAAETDGSLGVSLWTRYVEARDGACWLLAIRSHIAVPLDLDVRRCSVGDLFIRALSSTAH